MSAYVGEKVFAKIVLFDRHIFESEAGLQRSFLRQRLLEYRKTPFLQSKI